MTMTSDPTPAALTAATDRCERANARMQELTWKAQNVRAELDAALREFHLALANLDRLMGRPAEAPPMQVVDCTGLDVARLGWDRLSARGEAESPAAAAACRDVEERP